MSDGSRSRAPVGPGEAARRLGVSTRTVQRWLREGRLPAVTVGDRMKVSPEAFSSLQASPPEPDLPRPIRRLLIANRGEPVVRIARTAKRLGMTVLGLDIPGGSAAASWRQALVETLSVDSYLAGEAIVAGAVARRVDAIHPGWGFLAEDATFAEAVQAAGIVWVGPPPAAMRSLGDKAAARRLAHELGIPTLPGYDGDDQSDAMLARQAKRIGVPVLLKPSAGGGGKGMHVVRTARELPETLAKARREARSSFGDDRMVLERYAEAPRHIEIQLLFDAHGNGVHLGERECSLQRRHQKVIEESPSPVVDEPLRKRLGDWALALGTAAGYVGAGTAEFLLTREGEPFFLELNARLQVEHPVTELVTGRDLVQDQLRIAGGEPLGFGQADVRFQGHAVEARLYAEDPWAAFVPSGGTIDGIRWPTGDGLRIDAGVAAPDVIDTRFDPMLAKLIFHASDRSAAVTGLRRAVDGLRIGGITTNRGFLGWLLRHPPVVDGTATTATIDADWHALPPRLGEAGWSAAAHQLVTAAGTQAGMRLNAPPRLRVRIGGEERSVQALGGARTSEWLLVRGADGSAGGAVLDLDGLAIRATVAPAPTVDEAMHHATRVAEGGDSVVAPMPGTILQVRVAEGDRVEAHDVLVLLEAMKMENAVTALADATVKRVLVAPGQTVQRGEVLVELG